MKRVTFLCLLSTSLGVVMCFVRACVLNVCVCVYVHVCWSTKRLSDQLQSLLWDSNPGVTIIFLIYEQIVRKIFYITCRN